MNRLHVITFRLLIFAVALSSCLVARTLAQKPTPSPSSQAATKPDDKAGKKEEQENPFAPEPAGPLPAGMTGAIVMPSASVNSGWRLTTWNCTSWR